MAGQTLKLIRPANQLVVLRGPDRGGVPAELAAHAATHGVGSHLPVGPVTAGEVPVVVDAVTGEVEWQSLVLDNELGGAAPDDDPATDLGGGAP